MPAHQLPSTPQATLGEPVESPHKLYRLTTTAVDAAGLSTCRVGSIPPQGFVRVSVSVNSEVLVDARFAAPIAVDSRHRFYEATFRLTRSRVRHRLLPLSVAQSNRCRAARDPTGVCATELRRHRACDRALRPRFQDGPYDRRSAPWNKSARPLQCHNPMTSYVANWAARLPRPE
jgi:hypothetical protein